MQYFLGYSTFTPEGPLDASLFVEFRKRLGMDCLNEINERIVALKTKMELAKSGSATGKVEGPDENGIGHTDDSEKKDRKYLETIRAVYQQQKQMYDTKSHSVEDRIVSIHQPHVRPIGRGKTTVSALLSYLPIKSIAQGRS